MQSIVTSIELLIQVNSAGFVLSNARSIGTDDGYCWEATLCKRKQKIVRVSNGGYGGPDEVALLGSTWDQVTALLKPLYELPLVNQFLKHNLVEDADLDLEFGKCNQEEYNKRIEEINSQQPVVTEDLLANLVDELREAKETASSLKRKLKGSVGWLNKGEENSNTWMHIKAQDTPELRKRLLEKYPTIAIFLNDLIKTV